MRGWLAYVVALGLGTAFAIWLLTWQDIFPRDVLHAASIGDAAISIIGQRYYLAAPWGWPLLQAPLLDWPGGVNVALTDSIPLALLVLKPFRAWLAPGASVSEAWFAFVIAVQPVAAVFALRAAGERRAVPAFAIAVLALCMPTFLHRSGHMALCSHAAILAALGLYCRLTSGRSGWLAAVCLLVGSMLLHPYIVALVAAVLAAVPLTRLLRGERGWWRALSGVGAGLAVCAGLAWLLGFGGSRPAPGFGFYSMNLLNPVLPFGSAIFRDVIFPDAGGTGWESYQYLGAGILMLLGIGLVQAARGKAGPWRRHTGLLVVMLGLTVFALSNNAYAGPYLLYRLGPVPAAIEQFRATSRFFWPVAYAILLAGVLVASRSFTSRTAMTVLLAATALQWVDTTYVRNIVRQSGADRAIWHIDTATLRPIFTAHTELTLWPSFGCGATPDSDTDTQVMLLASERLMRTNTMNTARDRADASCDGASTLGSPLGPGELRVITRPGDAWFVPDTTHTCRRVEPVVLCSANEPALAALPKVAVGELPIGQAVANPAPAFRSVLSQGWAVPEEAGVWSYGSPAILRLRPPSGPAKLTLEMSALAPRPGGTQTVEAAVGGVVQEQWVMPDQATEMHTLTLGPCAIDVCVVELRIAYPVRPIDRGTNQDPRPLGIFLRLIRLDAK